MRRTAVWSIAGAVMGVAASVALAAGGPQKTADGIDKRFTLDFESQVLASQAVPADGSIGADRISKVGYERAAVVFAVANDKADAGFDIVFQTTAGGAVGKPKNVGPLTPSMRGTSKCDFQLGVGKFELAGDVKFSTDGGMVAAVVNARGEDCKGAGVQGVAVWTVMVDDRGGSAVNGIFLRDMESLDSIMTLREDAGMPGNGASIVLGQSPGGDPISYVIQRRTEAAR